MKKVLIGFFPALHDGYFSLLEKEDWETVYWFSEDILKKWDRYENLKRDLRWSDLSKIPELIKKSGIVKEIKMLDEELIKKIRSDEIEITMPDEDISHWFVINFIPEKEINFEKVFLRADFSHVIKNDFVDPDAVITEEEMHQNFMSKAQTLKEKSPDWWRQIAAIAVIDGEIIESTCNHGLPTDFRTSAFGDPRSQFNAGENIEICSCIHAEASLVAHVAGRKDVSLKDADIYVTVFPCPVCAKLLSETGIKRVFYRDGYSKGEGKEVLKAAGIELIKVA